MMLTEYPYWFLTFIQLSFGGLNKFYINNYIFLCMMIIKCLHTCYDET